jgi:hypothetical protein
MRRGMVGLCALMMVISLGNASCITETTKHFASDGVTFDYPGRWQLSLVVESPPVFSLPVQAVGQLTGDRYAQMDIYWLPIPVESSFKELFLQGYSRLDSADPPAREAKTSETMIGTKGLLVKEYQVPHGETYLQYRDLWWQKEDRLYIFSLHATLGNFDGMPEELKIVLESFDVVFQPIPTSTATIGRYTREDLTFEYPIGWEISTRIGPIQGELQAKTMCSLHSTVGPYRSLLLWQRDLPQGTTMEKMFRDTYLYMEDPTALVRDVSDGTLAVAGQTALVKWYTRPSGEPWWRVQDIWLQAGSKIMILQWSTDPDQFLQSKAEFDQILSTVRLTPASTETPVFSPTAAPTSSTP